MIPRMLNVAALERSTNDSRATLWWGNIALIAIESAMFAMLIATYFYLRTVNIDWPPSGVPRPPFARATMEMAILLLSLVPMFLADRGALAKRKRPVQLGFAISLAAIAALFVTRTLIFIDLGYKWSSHAYGSVVWTMLGLHSLHLLIAFGEIALLLIYSTAHGLSKKQYLDMRATAVYWYFVTISWIPMYLILFVGPRLGWA